MIKRLQARHKDHPLAAARNWMALFSGEENYAAMVAAMRFDTFVEAVIALVKAIGKRK